MISTLRTLYAVHPLLTTGVLILFVGWAALITGVFALAAAAAIEYYWCTVRRTHGRRVACEPWEYSMNKRFTLVAALAIALTSISLLPGCGTFGNGDSDGVLVDFEIVWESNLGHTYTLASQDGQLFVSAKGDLYEVSPDGFAITAPDGLGGSITTRITRAEQDPTPPPEIGADPEAEAAIAHAQAAVG